MKQSLTLSHEQSQGIEQVNLAITQMDETTQQNAALVEQAAAAAQSLQEQAMELSGAVSVFKLLQDSRQGTQHDFLAAPASSVRNVPATALGAVVAKPAPKKTPPAFVREQASEFIAHVSSDWEVF